MIEKENMIQIQYNNSLRRGGHILLNNIQAKLGIRRHDVQSETVE